MFADALPAEEDVVEEVCEGFFFCDAEHLFVVESEGGLDIFEFGFAAGFGEVADEALVLADADCDAGEACVAEFGGDGAVDVVVFPGGVFLGPVGFGEPADGDDAEWDVVNVVEEEGPFVFGVPCEGDHLSLGGGDGFEGWAAGAEVDLAGAELVFKVAHHFGVGGAAFSGGVFFFVFVDALAGGEGSGFDLGGDTFDGFGEVAVGECEVVA